VIAVMAARAVATATAATSEPARSVGARTRYAYNAAMSRMFLRPADVPPMVWLPLCPLLPACTGPVTGITLMLAAAATALVCAAGRHGVPPDRSALLPCLLLAAGMVALIDLVLRAGLPSLHAQIGAALPWLTLVGLPAASHADRGATIRTLLPAMAAILVLALVHSLIPPGTLSAELQLLDADPDIAHRPVLNWLSPAASLIGLALVLAASRGGSAAAGVEHTP
jgi:Na+-translocating ferredoxin:NAD+ oxidoreductase RnfE subunit